MIRDQKMSATLFDASQDTTRLVGIYQIYLMRLIAPQHRYMSGLVYDHTSFVATIATVNMDHMTEPY